MSWKKKKREKDILLNIKIVINVLIDLILTAWVTS